MSVSQSLRGQAYVVEKYVTLSATSGTTVGPAIPAGTLVLSAGVEVLAAVPDVTTYTIDVTDGTTVFANDVSVDAAAKGTIVLGTTAGLIAAADTVDAVSTISGSPGAIAARIFAVCVDVTDSVGKGAAVVRNTLA